MALVHRVTMFKVDGADKQKQLLAAYEKVARDAKKDGKPYIVYLSAGLANAADPRTKGYTVVAESKFKTMDDMKFYDEGCAAHAALKTAVRGMGVAEPPMSAYFEAATFVDDTHHA